MTKPILTRFDVGHAQRIAGKRPVTNIDTYDQDMADYLNAVIALRAKQRRRRAGTIVETIAVIGVLVGITVGLSNPGHAASAAIAVMLSFVIGLIGWGMGEDT